uniref:C2H2-type domain-containing protein n=1 Tax=Phlebotomus papatasi TaxID=29031 RepID=A0A1B0D322_PHLPP
MRTPNNPDGDLKLFLSRIDGMQFKINKPQEGIPSPKNDKTPPYTVDGEEEFDLPEVKLEFVDGGYKCSECDKIFPTKGGYVYHSYTHSGARPYKCRRCSAEYRSSGNLKYHEKTVHKIVNCGGRRYHERDGHLDRQTYMAAKGLLKTENEDGQTVEGEENSDTVQLDTIPECTICKKTFRTVGYMRQHQRRAHRMRFQF